MSKYTISQVAEQLSLKVHTIRYWEKHVPMLGNVDRDERGTRLYSRQDLYLLMRMKYYIEERRFTVKGAAEELINEMSDSTESAFSQRKEILAIMKRLEIQRQRLDTARDLLKQDIDDYFSEGNDETIEMSIDDASQGELEEDLSLDMDGAAGEEAKTENDLSLDTDAPLEEALPLDEDVLSDEDVPLDVVQEEYDCESEIKEDDSDVILETNTLESEAGNQQIQNMRENELPLELFNVEQKKYNDVKLVQEDTYREKERQT